MTTEPTSLFAKDRKPKLDKRPLLEPHELAEQGPPEAVRLPLSLVDPSPSNPRRALQDVEALAESIRDPSIGLLQPILVRRMGERYEVLAGHRRRAAFLLLSEQEPFEVRWKSIPAVVRTAGDEAAYLMLLSSQLHSKQWSPKEESAALETLAVEHTLREIGDIVHRSVNWVSTRLRTYSDAILSPLVQTRRLTNAVAEELLLIEDIEVKRQYALKAIAEEWTREHARSEVRKLKVDAQIRQLDRDVLKMLDVLSSIEPGKMPIETFRNLQVLRGRIEQIADTARGPVFPSIEAAQAKAGVNPSKPAIRRRTRLRTN